HQAGRRGGSASPSRSRRTIGYPRSSLRPPSFGAGHRDPDRSLYWRSRRDLLLDLDRGRSTGAQILRGCSRHWRIGRLPVDRPVLPVYTVRPAPNAKKGTGRVLFNPPSRLERWIPGTLDLAFSDGERDSPYCAWGCFRIF